MKGFILEKDRGLALARTAGKRSRGPSWQIAATAKLAPQLLANCNEETIQAAIEGEIQSYGAAYLHLPGIIYTLLKREASRGSPAAMEALAYIKDFPDLMVFRKVPGEDFLRALPLELKRRKESNKGTAGQRRLAAALGGVIALGFEAAHDALKRFFL